MIYSTGKTRINSDIIYLNPKNLLLLFVITYFYMTFMCLHNNPRKHITLKHPRVLQLQRFGGVLFGGDTRIRTGGSWFCKPVPYRLAMSPHTFIVHHLRRKGTLWSGRRGSNSLPPPWQGGALPDELRPHIGASGRN